MFSVNKYPKKPLILSSFEIFSIFAENKLKKMTKEIQENAQNVIQSGIDYNGIRPTMFDSLNYALEGYVILKDGAFRSAYNKQTIIETLTKEYNDSANLEEDDDPMEMAYEHFYYNILGTGLSEGTPVFIQGYYDDYFTDLEVTEDEHDFLDKIVEDGHWSIFVCDAENFEYDYLLVFDAKKMKAFDISTKDFPNSSAFLHRLSD